MADSASAFAAVPVATREDRNLVLEDLRQHRLGADRVARPIHQAVCAGSLASSRALRTARLAPATLSLVKSMVRS
jgi:hypothetical protein